MMMMTVSALMISTGAERGTQRAIGVIAVRTTRRAFTGVPTDSFSRAHDMVHELHICRNPSIESRRFA